VIDKLQSQFGLMIDYPVALLEGKYGSLSDTQKEFVQIIYDKSKEALGLVLELGEPCTNHLSAEACYDVAHSLNGFLTPIIGYAFLLHSGALGPLSPEQSGLLQKILDTGNDLRDRVFVTFVARPTARKH
jgi:hypothetical protein